MTLTKPRNSRATRRRRAHLQRLLRRQKWRCYWCQIKVMPYVAHGHPCKATFDHLVTKSAGGGNALSNKVVACYACNQRRRDTDAETWAAQLAAERAGA
jgi:hypothetical protein